MIERDSRTGSILYGTRLPVLGLNRTIEGRTRRRPRPTTGQASRLLAVHRGRRAWVADEARISASRLRKPWSQTTRPRPIRPGGHQAADPQVRGRDYSRQELDQRALRPPPRCRTGPPPTARAARCRSPTRSCRHPVAGVPCAASDRSAARRGGHVAPRGGRGTTIGVDPLAFAGSLRAEPQRQPRSSGRRRARVRSVTRTPRRLLPCGCCASRR